MGDVSDQTMQLMRRMPSERICVLVVGDQGVGKTSLVRCMCNEIDGKCTSKPSAVFSACQLLTERFLAMT